MSTEAQSNQIQEDDLIEYASHRGWEVVQVFQEKASGTSTDRRPQFKTMMERLRRREADICLVYKLDRIFRSMKDCVQNLTEFAELNIQFVSLRDSGIDTSPSGKLLLHLLAAFADFEASLIRDRVKSGVRAKIAKTGKWGPERKRDDNAILKLRQAGLSIRQIAKRLSISSTSVMRSLKAVPGTPAKASA